jgi:tetratricopeptide (TPR) repeat protein/CHAT domain-containing protein
MLALAACLLGEGGANAADRGHGIVSFVAATADGPVAAALQGAERARQILSGGQAPSPQDVEELISLAPQVNAGAVAAFKAGQLDEAVMLFETALGIDEAVLPPKHPKLVQSLHNLAFVYQKARLFDDAEAAYRRALALREELLPANHPEVAINLADLGSLLANTGRPEQAEPLYERALAIREASLPENDPLIVRSLVQLADTYNLMGRYAKQEPLMRRALAMQEASLPADHPDIAATLNKLAGVLGDLGQEAQAESLYRRALSIRERSYPENHPAISATLADLANTLVNLGRFEEAEALHLKALAMRETVAADHPDVAASLHALAGLHEDLGHYDEAETLLKRAIAIREQFPDGRRRLANSLSSLADLYKEAGRYAESETLSKRALAIRQEILPEGHAEISISLNGLASTYAAAQRYDEAEELFQRSLELREAALPAGHSLIRTAFNNLASLYETTGRYDDAEALYMRALGGVAPASISDPALADTIDNLARLYDRTARPEEALPLHERALALMEASLPASHPSIATNLNNQAATLDRLGLHAKAENLRRRSLEINENALPATHPNRIAGLTNLAYSIARQERFEEASSLSRRAIASILEAGADDAETFRGDFLQDASLSLQLEPDANAGTHAFAAHQWPMGGAAGAAIAAANARGSGSDELRALARRSDRLGEEIAATDRLLTTALAAAGNRTLVEELRGRYDRLLAERAAAEASMAKLFPAYADLSGPKPLTVAEAQSLLGPKEALVSFMLTGDAAIPGFVFAVTADGLGWGWIKDSEEVWRLSGELRALMTGGNRSAASLSAKETPSEQRARDIPAIAHRLHELLLGPVAERLAGKRDLIIVPDPFLADLPMHLLVTQKPEDGASPAQAFRAARWLIRDHTVTVLPAISSLRSLRQHSGKTASAAKPFLAFADPVIGSGGAMRCAEPAALQAVDAPDAPLARSVDIGSAALFRSGVAADGQMLADVEIVRGLPRLADTRCEALAIAAALGGSPADLLFEGDATETRLKQLSQTGALAQQRVLLFATHGLAPGEIGSAEPALVLTPPRQASSTDDGLLTASEVAGLDLNADFVILSACNTASAGATGGQSFSGLARAFFYAGAKSLLVSHWPVYSDAAVKLTTRALAAGAGVSRAEAMRLAMLSMIDDAAQPADADPVRWAPFSLVGESSGI